MTDLFDAVRAATADMNGKVNLMVGRGLILNVSDDGAIQTAQVKLMDDEPHDDVERVQEYGFTSVPLPGAELVFASIGGNRDHGVIVAVDDRRYRLQGLEGGEMAIYDDQGQKVHLTRGGIVIDGAGKPIAIRNTPEVGIESPMVRTSGDMDVAGTLTVGGDIVGQGEIKDHGNKSMSAMRATYNGHDHSNPEGGRVGHDQGQM